MWRGMSRPAWRLRPRGTSGNSGRTRPRRPAWKYLLLKHYRGAPEAVNDVPMDQWTPEEIEDHVQYMGDFAARLEGTGEYVDGQALSPEGTFVRYDGEGRPPVTDGPFAETKDLIAGWMVIDVDSYERALALAGELSAAPGAGGKPIHEWLELRPFLGAAPTVTECHGSRPISELASEPMCTAADRPGRIRWRSGDGRTAAAGADSRGDRRPRPSRSRLRDGRGRRAGSTPAGRADLAGPAARRPEGLAGHGCLAQVPRRPPLRGRASRPGAAGREPSRRPDRPRPRTTRCSSSSCAPIRR